MKIDPLVGEIGSQPTPSAQKSPRPKQAFGELLAAQMQPAPGAAAESPTTIEAVNPATHLAGAGSALNGATLNRTACELENLLKQWADLSELAAEPGSSAKAIQSRIEALAQSGRTLQVGLDALPEDHPLRRIADELSVLSYVESVKWRRGDYL